MPEKPSEKAHRPKIHMPKLGWDKSIQKRVDSIDKSASALAKKVDDFVSIHDQELENVREESLSEVDKIRQEVEGIIDRLKTEHGEKSVRLEEKLSQDFGERLGEFEEKIRGIGSSLEEVERRLFEGANEVGIIKSSIESKNIGTKVQFLDDQVEKAAEILKRLNKVLNELEEKSPVGIEKRLEELENRVDSGDPMDITELKMKVEALEKSVGNKELMKKVKLLSDRVKELEEATA